MPRSLLFSSIALLPVALATPSLSAPPDQPGHQSPAPGTTNDTMSAWVRVIDTSRSAQALALCPRNTNQRQAHQAHKDHQEILVGLVVLVRLVPLVTT